LRGKVEAVKAYILVNAKPGKVRDVARQIAAMPGVTAANACWGMPDVFVVAEVESAEELNRLVIDKIQPLDGVERTDTHIAIE
jgi:DNA-binding Lrp family transcriptional regulator